MKKSKQFVKSSSVFKKASSKDVLDRQKKKLLGLVILAVLLVVGAWVVTNGQSLFDFRGWAAGKACKSASNEKSCTKLGCRWVPTLGKQKFEDCKTKDCESGRPGCSKKTNKNGKTQCEGKYPVNVTKTNGADGNCIGTPTVQMNQMKENGKLCLYHGANYRDGERFDYNGEHKICRKGDVYGVECIANSALCRTDAPDRYSYVRCDVYGQIRSVERCNKEETCINGTGCVLKAGPDEQLGGTE